MPYTNTRGAVLAGFGICFYILVLATLSYTDLVWGFAFLMLLLTILSPLLGKSSLEIESAENDLLQIVDHETVADTVYLSASEDVEAYSVGVMERSIVVSEGAVD